MKNLIYYSPIGAVVELKRRQALGIREEIEEWWRSKSWPIPNIPAGEFGMLGRQIATARYEDLLFSEIVKAVGLNPLWLEYTMDKFFLHSSYKRSLIHMIHCSGKGKNDGWKIRKEKLACVHHSHGKLLTDIQTKHGSLVEYHHAFQKKFIPDAVRIDISDTFRQGYAVYLSLFIAHGILFEDFHGGESGVALDGFTANVFQPAWKILVDELGIKPLITPLPWWDGMQFYPANHNWLEHGVFDRQSIEKLIHQNK